MKKNEIKQLTDVQHILQRSDLFGLRWSRRDIFIMKLKINLNIKILHMFLHFCKIINEIIDNALDDSYKFQTCK